MISHSFLRNMFIFEPYKIKKLTIIPNPEFLLFNVGLFVTH